MSDINLLILENDNEDKPSFLKKHGKKLLVAGGLAALGAGGAAAYKHRDKFNNFRKKETSIKPLPQKQSFKDKFKSHIKRHKLKYALGAGALSTIDNYRSIRNDPSLSTKEKLAASALGGLIDGGVTYGIGHLISRK